MLPALQWLRVRDNLRLGALFLTLLLPMAVAYYWWNWFSAHSYHQKIEVQQVSKRACWLHPKLDAWRYYIDHRTFCIYPVCIRHWTRMLDTLLWLKFLMCLSEVILFLLLRKKVHNCNGQRNYMFTVDVNYYSLLLFS